MKKVILITGGGKGIGRAMALNLSRMHLVFIISRTRSDLLQVQKIAQQAGNHLNWIVADITKSKDRLKIITTIIKKMGKLDVLINNAGIGYSKPIDELEEQSVERLFNTNIKSMIYLTKLVAKLFKQTRSGHIINISSTAGLESRFKNDTAYCASKFAVTGFSQALFQDLREYNIKVTTIFPDFVNTWGAKKNSGLLEPNQVASLIESIINTPPNVVVREMRITTTTPYQFKATAKKL